MGTRCSDEYDCMCRSGKWVLLKGMVLVRCRRSSDVAAAYERRGLGELGVGCCVQTGGTAHCWNRLFVSKLFERLVTEQIRR